MSLPQSIKLYYFDVAGRAEAIRNILKIGKIKFEDIRFSRVGWPQKKPTFPFQHVPMLEVDGIQISETLAVLHYAATIAKLVPEDPQQAAIGDTVIHVLQDATSDICPWIKAPPETRESVGKGCWSSVSERLNLLNIYIKKHIKDGFIAGGKLSAADVVLYTYVKLLEGFPVPVEEEIKEKYPAIASVMSSVAPTMMNLN